MSRAPRAIASTSLPLAAAAAVATLFASPAGAVPNEQPSTPNNPAPAQPGTGESQSQPGTIQANPEDLETSPTPSQPGVTTPDPNHVMPPRDPKLSNPTQPGVTTPRVAPLPVPGHSEQPAVVPGAEPQAAQPGARQPGIGATTPGSDSNVPADESDAQTLLHPRWKPPRLQAAPAAPVIEMTGPHAEVSANVDGGTILPGHVANTHHFSNEAGYVGTIGYRTPTGAGEAGVSVEFLDVNHIKVTSYTGGEGLADNKSTMLLDTTELNAAKAAVENWIAAQPGGAAALETAAQAKLPSIVSPGEVAPTTVTVAGVTTQWGGSLQY